MLDKNDALKNPCEELPHIDTKSSEQDAWQAEQQRYYDSLTFGEKFGDPEPGKMPVSPDFYERVWDEEALLYRLVPRWKKGNPYWKAQQRMDDLIILTLILGVLIIIGRFLG
jgi:hypothetical protein